MKITLGFLACMVAVAMAGNVGAALRIVCKAKCEDREDWAPYNGSYDACYNACKNG